MKKFFKKASLGESMVSMTSLGLAIGVMMTVGLLLLILVKGFESFWPKPIYEISLKQPDANVSIGSSLFGQKVSLKENKSFENKQTEWQFFLGNRELYGASFKYIPEDDIVKLERAVDTINLERLEYGRLLGVPLYLEWHDGKKLEYASADFAKTFKQELHHVEDLRKKLLKIEKKEMGYLSEGITHNKDEIKRLEYLQEKEGIDYSSQITALKEGIQYNQDQFLGLEEQTAKLREQQKRSTLHYALASGEQHEIELAEIIRYYYPNQMNVFEKIGHFCISFWYFLSENPREANTEGGVFPAIFGTFLMTILMSILVMPFGVIAAIYLREYAKQGFLVRAVRISVNNLAGVPSIVFGLFGVGFFIYGLGGNLDDLLYPWRSGVPTWGKGGIMWAALTLALMTLPVVIVATEEALSAVPRGVREAALACGASKWQTIQRIVLPSAAPGIMTGLILAMARGAGEVAPLMLVGVVKFAPELPIGTEWPFGLNQSFMHLGFHIYDLGFQSPDSEAAKPMVFATTFLLIMLVVILNLFAIKIRSHLSKKYGSSGF